MRRISALIILIIAGGFHLSAQVNDAGLWMSFNAEKKINPVLSANLSEEFRIDENFCELGTFFTDAGITYKFKKYIRISANYRFSNKRQVDDSYSKRHRYYLDLTFRYKLKPVIFSFRTRIQSQYKDMFSSSLGKIPDYYSRNKVTLKFDLDKKYAPYISTESYTPLLTGEGLYIDNVRYCAGIEYQLNRVHGFDIFYLIQMEYNVNNPRNDYVVGIGYFLTL